MNTQIDLKDWYTVKEATERLTANSGRVVDPNYVRSLARYGKIGTIKIGNASLYSKVDVNGYIVEEPGKKSGRAKRQGAVGKGKKTKRAA